MRNKLLTIAVMIMLALTLSLALAACNDKAYPIPEELTVNVQIYDGETLLGTVTKDTLEVLTQETITMTTTNDYETTKTSVYVAYSVSAAAEELGITLPSPITSVKSYATDSYSAVYEMTTLENSYISIGFEDDGAFAADEDGPRFISDKTSGSSNSVAKFIAKIVINPPADPDEGGENGGENGGDEEAEEILAFTITPEWTDGGRTLTVVFKDIVSDKTNRITLSTPEGESVVTAITIDENPAVDLSSSLLISYENKGTLYYGYKLDDIIAKMGKYRSGEAWMSFVEEYTAVGFVCSDDEAEADYSARVYTKAEVDGETDINIVFDAGATVQEGTTRVYSGLSDTDPATYRNKLKKVLSIQIFALETE